MRKEFEENEESKKTLENNLEIQDEIDDETFQKILEEEFIEREKQIEEALFADEDFEDLKLTDKEVQDSYQELMRRFEENKKKSAEFSEELVPDEKNEKSNLDEEVAVAEIEEKLNVEVPQFYYRPYKFEFSNYVIDELTSLARIEYDYKKNLIVLLIDKQNDGRSSRIKSACGDEQNLIVTSNDGTIVQIKRNYDDEETSYSAEWEKNGVTYTLSGKIELEEIKKIIKKMLF